ncbi:hypothetical protein ACFV7R_44670 [Streptomyces sp. NPDC059866]|uniref:hypothetical protein n=1 Tax=Streptomyces sp. NPDC059866 TaxID=3346978 RepID=UPI003652CC3C
MTGQLEAAREMLSRLVITRETVAEVMAETSREVAGTGNEEESAKAAGVEQAPFAGRKQGLAVDVLPKTYRDIVEVVADAPGPVRTKQIVPRIGLPTETAEIEGTRSKLKRLVERGWLDEETPGLFTPARRRTEAKSVNSR